MGNGIIWTCWCSRNESKRNDFFIFLLNTIITELNSVIWRDEENLSITSNTTNWRANGRARNVFNFGNFRRNWKKIPSSRLPIEYPIPKSPEWNELQNIHTEMECIYTLHYTHNIFEFETRIAEISDSEIS